MESKSYNNNITFVHIMCSLCVSLGHQYVLMNSSAPSLLGMSIHGIGVNLLFLISGYLSVKSFIHSSSAGVYLIKRAKRIFPGFFLSLIIVMMLLFPFSGAKMQYFHGAARYFVDNIMLYPRFSLPGIFDNNPYSNAVNGSLWTIPVEIFCFMLLALIFSIGKFFDRKNKAESNTIKTIWIFIFVFCMAVEIYSNLSPESRWIFYGTDWVQGLKKHSIFPLVCFMLCSSWSTIIIGKSQ